MMINTNKNAMSAYGVQGVGSVYDDAGDKGESDAKLFTDRPPQRPASYFMPSRMKVPSWRARSPCIMEKWLPGMW